MLSSLWEPCKKVVTCHMGRQVDFRYLNLKGILEGTQVIS